MVGAGAIADPMPRRRWAEEELALHVMRLARENAALDDFASLVAHDLKAALLCALREPDPFPAIGSALELVDSILEMTRAESTAAATADVPRCIEEALDDLGRVDATVAADVAPTLPLPPAVLRLLLRNLLRNAVAAGSRRIRVSTEVTEGRCTLAVDDDGVGVNDAQSYSAGSGLGLRLSRRLAARFGGAVDVTPRPLGGTRATLVFPGVAG